MRMQEEEWKHGRMVIALVTHLIPREKLCEILLTRLLKNRKVASHGSSMVRMRAVHESETRGEKGSNVR